MAWTKKAKPTATYTKIDKLYQLDNFLLQDGSNFLFQEGSFFVFEKDLEIDYTKVAKP